MKINEIFYNIQGEGKNFGVPTIFVRFQGCNLIPGCRWCDTSYARVHTPSVKELLLVEVEAVIDELVHRRYATTRPTQFLRPHICITGGEPLSQCTDVMNLVGVLKDHKYYIEIFTNGTISPPAWAHRVDSWVVDIKCPSAGIASPPVLDWLSMRLEDQVKFVVADAADLEYARRLLSDNICRSEVLISPMIPLGVKTLGPLERMWATVVVDFCKKYGYRFSWQQHKLLYGNRKGV